MKIHVYNPYYSVHAVVEASNLDEGEIAIGLLELGLDISCGNVDDWNEEIDALMENGYTHEEAEDALYADNILLLGDKMVCIEDFMWEVLPPNAVVGVYASSKEIKYNRLGVGRV